MANYSFVSNKSRNIFGAGDYIYNYQDIDKKAFLDYIKQYEGTDWYNQYLNAYNVYFGQSFTPNLFQDIGESWFGDFSSRTNFDNQRLTQFYDSLARIQDAQHQESYNSEPSQVERSKQAGLNPDLNGGQGLSPGQAGNIDQSDLAQTAINDGSSVLPSVAETALQVVSLGMSMAQGFQQLSVGDINIAGASLDLFGKSNQVILDTFRNGLSEDEVKDLLDSTNVSNERRNFLSSKLGDLMQSVYTDPRISSNLRRKLKHSWKPGASSVAVNSEMYKILKNLYSEKQGAIEGLGNPFNQGGFKSCIDKISKHIQKCVIDIRELQSKFESDRLKVIGDNGVSLGTLAGQSDSAAFSAEKQAKEYQSKVDEMWNSIMHDLEQEDSWWASVLRFLIPIARSIVSNLSLPSVSHSTSTGIGNNGQPTQNSSTSFGF